MIQQSTQHAPTQDFSYDNHVNEGAQGTTHDPDLETNHQTGETQLSGNTESGFDLDAGADVWTFAHEVQHAADFANSSSAPIPDYNQWKNQTQENALKTEAACKEFCKGCEQQAQGCYFDARKTVSGKK